MSKKLAIVGHPTRGNEVIELLKMMGGVNTKNVDGKCDFFYYFIDNDNTILYDSNFVNNFAYFTLEEFFKKFLYKVGDEFCSPYDKITEMFWDDEDEWVYYKTEKSEGFITALDIMTDSYARCR